MTLVFVYGTLKRGGSNHGHLAGQAYVGDARTAPGYTLYELDGYPGMVARDGQVAGVTGEVWSVDEACLANLDELEGTAAGLYRREAVALLAPFADRGVEAYIYLQPIEGRRALGETWSG